MEVVKEKKRLVVGLSGASGIIYGIRLLEILHPLAEYEVHLVISNAARETLRLETEYTLAQIQDLADICHDNNNIAASIASGSFLTVGMVVLPCSIKTLSGITSSYNDDLITRAADVTLKERRPLVLGLRETPLHKGHLRLMLQAGEIGATIMPLVTAFYHKPVTIDDIVNQMVNRILDQLNIRLPQDLFQRWGE